MEAYDIHRSTVPVCREANEHKWRLNYLGMILFDSDQQKDAQGEAWTPDDRLVRGVSSSSDVLTILFSAATVAKQKFNQH